MYITVSPIGYLLVDLVEVCDTRALVRKCTGTQYIPVCVRVCTRPAHARLVSHVQGTTVNSTMYTLWYIDYLLVCVFIFMDVRKSRV